MDWEALATTSPYQTAVAIKDTLEQGDLAETSAGLEELIDALSRSDTRALKSYLIRLMQHVIKWHIQPERRSYSWIATIDEARRQIRELQEEHPRFTDQRICDKFWESCMHGACNEVRKELNVRTVQPPDLTWDRVMHDAYDLDLDSETTR